MTHVHSDAPGGGTSWRPLGSVPPPTGTNSSDSHSSVLSSSCHGPRCSDRLRGIEPKVYTTPRGRFPINQIYGRDAEDEKLYWIMWFGYGKKDDTVQHLDRLVEDGFEDMCDFGDASMTGKQKRQMMSGPSDSSSEF